MIKYEYEVAFSAKEILKALIQQAVNEFRLPNGELLDVTMEVIKDEREMTHIIVKANRVDDKVS